MTGCKCGADTFEGHLAANYAAHVYTGFFWRPHAG